MRPALAEANTAHAGNSQPSRAEAVSDIAHRLDVLTGQLAAQSSDIDVDHIAPRVEAEAPDVRQELVSGTDLIGSSHEMAQKEKLALPQRRTPPAGVQLASLEVELDRSDPKPSTRRWRGWMPGEPGVDPGEQLGDGKGFREIVDGAAA